jgi:hypothetical protein
MPRFSELQAAFNAGELAPRLAARLDFAKYPAGLETCKNVIPMPEGGLQRRAGTRYVAAAKSSTVKARLKPFKFSVIQAYMLEMGDSVMRFFRHQGLISVATTTATVTNGTFPSGITDWDDRSTGSGSIAHDATNLDIDLVPGGATASDIGWAEQDITTGTTNTEHVIKFKVVGAPGDKIEFQVGTAASGAQTLAAVEKEVGYHCVAFTPTTSPFYIGFRNLGSFRNKTVSVDDISIISNAGVEIDTPWAEAEVFDVEGPQSADVLYLFHDATPTYKLQRFGHTTWSLVEVPWEDGPYLDLNTTATTLTPSAATGMGITLTLSAAEGVNGGLGWVSTDVGRTVRYFKTDQWGWAVITSITTNLIAVADVRGDFKAAPDAQTTWRIGSWSATTGYPQTGVFFEQRLYAGANTDQPTTFWASQTADFENHKLDDDNDTIAADDSLQYSLSADDVNAIRWLSANEDTLAIGTAGGEWTPAASGIVITPLDITVRRQTTHGSARVQPVRIGNVVLFLQRAKRRIRELGFSIETDGFVAPDMSRLARHITTGGITQLDYAQEPDSVVWATRADGQLLSLTFRREEDVVGWARHVIGGSFLDDNTALTRVWQVDDSAGTFVEETPDANDTGDADWTLFPASEAVGDYAAFGFTSTFAQLKFDYANGTAGIGGAVAWQYWNGTAWTSLSVTDGTTGFTAAAADGLTVTWTAPSDWATKAISSGESLYYVRAVISTVYTTNPILDQGFVQGTTDAVVESVAVIPGDNGSGQTHDSTSRDEVWVSVKRTINGATARYIEFIERDFETGQDQEDAYYCDSVITYDGVATTALSGLDHLEGETVKVWADGAVHPDATVASGAITLDLAASVVQIGLGYTHTIKTLKVVAGNPAGTALGRTKRIYGLTFALLNSHTLKYGPLSTSLQEQDFRVVADPMDVGAPLFTGEKFVEFPGDWASDPRIIIESDEPAPFTLLAIAPEINLNPLK